MDKAELKCRKLHTGEIPWSPTYKRVNLILLYWHLRKSHVLGLNSNVRQLIVLQKKLHIVYDNTLDNKDIIKEIKEAHKQRKKIKLMAEKFSLEYRHKLALAKEEAGEIKVAVYLRNRNSIEGQRRISRNIKRMEGKSRGGSTTQINTTNTDGVTTEYTSKEPIEKIIAKGNDENSHQCEGRSQLLTHQFISDLGHHGEGKFTNKVLDGTYVYQITLVLLLVTSFMYVSLMLILQQYNQIMTSVLDTGLLRIYGTKEGNQHALIINM